MSARMVLIMGVTGSGKTTIGRLLAARMDLGFIDGDDLHGTDNVAKMSRGEPLTDADRLPWLDRVGEALAVTANPRGSIVSCSALRKLYRDHIRAITGPSLAIVYLDGTEAVIARRLAARRDHFMPPALLASQFATLEMPTEEPDVVAVQIDQPIVDIVETAATLLR